MMQNSSPDVAMVLTRQEIYGNVTASVSTGHKY